MTEADWNSCTSPLPLLEFVRINSRANERKLRLFSCACCRQVWHCLRDGCSRHAVEVAEHFAHGQVGQAERIHVCETAWGVVDWDALEVVRDWAAIAATLAVSDGDEIVWDMTGRLINPIGHPETPEGRAAVVAFSSLQAAAWDARMCERHDHTTWSVGKRAWHWVGRVTMDVDDFALWARTLAAQQNQQAFLLRDLFGPLPFREVLLDPDWLTWNDGTVRKLAQAIYDERILPGGTLEQSWMRILADALEEAGCDNKEILSHCRQPDAVHVRGCWLIDLLLNKA